MADTPTPTPTPDDALRHLEWVQRFYDEDLSDRELTQFNAMLRESPELRRVFVDYSKYCSVMSEALGVASLWQTPLVAKEISEEGALAITQNVEPVRDRPLMMKEVASAASYLARHALLRKPVILGGIAALLVLAVTLFLVFTGGSDDPTPPLTLDGPTQSPPTGPFVADPRPIVATLTAERDAKWDRRPGEGLYAGQRFTLIQGFAEITTRHGAVALIQAPATIELIDSPNALHLHTGRLVGLCHTDSSKGFVVKTDHADITDLGTEFGVEVETGRVTTTVFSGEVEFHAPGGQPQLLVTDQTARLTVEGNNRELMVEDGLAEGFEALAPRQMLAESLRNDPAMIAYYGFEAEDVVDGKLLNRAKATQGSMDGVLGQPGRPDSSPQLAAGRWQGTTALRFEAAEYDLIRLSTKDAKAIDGLEQFTIGLWVKPDQMMDQVSHHLITKRTPDRIALNFGLSWEVKPGSRYHRDAVFFLCNTETYAGSDVTSEADSLQRDSGWMHLVVTYDRGERAIFLDGQLLQRLPRTDSGRMTALDAELIIGAAAPHLDVTATYLDGDLDELFILGRMMSEAEINLLYETGVAQP